MCKKRDKGIDRYPSVVMYANMWRDALIAKYQQYNYLRTKTKDGLSGNMSAAKPNRILEDYLHVYSGSLLMKYGDRIHINIPVFENIKLTRIDMAALN